MSETTLGINGFAETDGTLTVHNYSQFNGEYVGSGLVYLAKGVGIPAYSTTLAPSATKPGYAQVFSALGKAWAYSEDHRGQVVYNKETSQPFTITELGPIDATIYSVDKPDIVVPLKTQATNAQVWIAQQASLASAMSEVFTADMKAYVKAIAAIANGTDTTSTALPTQPTDILTS